MFSHRLDDKEMDFAFYPSASSPLCAILHEKLDCANHGLGPWCSPTGSPAPLSCETGCGEGSWILVCRLLVPTQVSLLSMEEDIDTRKINNSFLRDHSYATEDGSKAIKDFSRGKHDRVLFFQKLSDFCAGQGQRARYEMSGDGSLRLTGK
ncbi:Serine/threonine-protein phosphatase 2A 55 kDa regulatory subunit B beta isoform [Fukomys damarensis]|uniref:Serine/threonine-protein phosphatase 2A 55 kDa regulatory subunit B beta isoform n=1 Tax=Fukomys damarensis TaxID=885580 RepID=A0A091DLK0_FUKDA|nr:Serine/threonine-protein phosphatase 2A 55 kDa regulatory subunit B beta isoform [Fukomys damarensis]